MPCDQIGKLLMVLVLIGLFRLPIFFSQYRSCELLLCSLKRLHVGIKMSNSWVSSHDQYWENKIDKQKRSITVSSLLYFLMGY